MCACARACGGGNPDVWRDAVLAALVFALLTRTPIYTTNSEAGVALI